MRKISTSEILIIITMYNKYYTFTNDLNNLLEDGNKKQIAKNLEKLMLGFQPIANHRVKSFYRKYKVILETIYEFSDINTFICNNYDENGLKKDSNLDFIYNLIDTNKKNIQQIFALVNNLYNLGFSTINYDEKTDFTKSTYTIDSKYDYNGEIIMLDNMELLPSYPLSKIEYKTSNSNYKIVLRKLCFGQNMYEQAIYLNSFLFDSNRLPNKLDMKEIFDSIIKLRDDKKDIIKKLKYSVELGVALDDFNDTFNHINNIIDSIEDEKSKETFKLKLIEISNSLKELQMVEDNYNLNNNPSVSSEIIDDEVKKFKKRREILTKI